MSDALLSQSSTRATGEDTWVDPELAARSRALAARGAVLLRNDGGALPLAPDARVALFGRVHRDWIAVGYGSGGDVNAPYLTTLIGGLRESGSVQIDEELAERYETWCRENPAEPGEVWGQWPRSYPEMPLEEAAITAAAQRSDVGIVCVGRAAGEDRENLLEPGSYHLTDAERTLIAQVSEAFTTTIVVIDAGNVMDLSWVEEHPIDAVLFAWLGGMEGGRAIADVLTGAVEPGGRLSDTVARRHEDYPGAAHFGDPEANDYVEDVFVGYRYFETFAPETVLFPFGFGLGYTTFSHRASVEETATGVRVHAQVTNTGERVGSDVVQVYLRAPQAPLATPSRALVGYARTGQIQPGASEDVEIDVPLDRMASYDDTGATGHRSAWVLQAGAYELHVGPNVREAALAGTVDRAETAVVEQLEEAAAARHPFERMTARTSPDGSVEQAWEPVPQATVDLRARILDRLPEAIGASEDTADGAESPSFADVVAGRVDLDRFVATLAVPELAALAYGDIIMDSPLGPPGNAGALGGVTDELRARGVPAAITTDGPSGLRLSTYASLLPCGTALACAWDPDAVRELAALHGQEMIRKGSDILLSPGMNIHRDPLCGRNFEYFSEDPLLAGTMAASVVEGIQSQGVSACPKHFAANNQETNRTRADSRVSERALREIYLRGFEHCVKTAQPRTIMTSYNRINGVWGHYHYDLVTTILRGQWGYQGLVMTDWWMQMAPDPDFPDLADSAYRVRAGVDVLMPGSIVHEGTEREDSIVESSQRPEGITLGEMQRTARSVLRYLLDAGIAERERMPQG